VQVGRAGAWSLHVFMVDECGPKDNGTAGLRWFLGIIERTDLNL